MIRIKIILNVSMWFTLSRLSSEQLSTNPVLDYLSFWLMIFMLTLESRMKTGLLLCLGGVAIFLYLMIQWHWKAPLPQAAPS